MTTKLKPANEGDYIILNNGLCFGPLWIEYDEVYGTLWCAGMHDKWGENGRYLFGGLGEYDVKDVLVKPDSVKTKET